MKPTVQFAEGDRLILTRTIGVLPQGTAGTVRRTFPLSQLYDVLFDGYKSIRVVHRDDLELEAPVLARVAGEGKPRNRAKGER